MKPSVLAERYRDFETSGLEFTIKLGENTVVVEVQHPEK